MSTPLTDMWLKFWSARPAIFNFKPSTAKVAEAMFKLGAAHMYRKIYRLGLEVEDKAEYDEAFTNIEAEIDTMMPGWRHPDAPTVKVIQ